MVVKEIVLISALVSSLMFTLVSGAFVAIAINTDVKAHNIQNRKTWTVLGFLFGLYAAAVYFIIRKKLIKKTADYCKYCDSEIPTDATACPQCNQTDFVKHINKSNKSTAVTIVCIILAVAFIFGGRFVSHHFSEFFESKIESIFTDTENQFDHIAYSPDNAPDIEYFYDRNQKAYIDKYDVHYFDQNGDEYIFEVRDKSYGLTNLSTDEFYKSEECFVDTDGYLVFDATLYELLDTYDFSVERDGVKYYMAAYVSWDNFGNLVDKYGLIIE